MSVSIFLKNYWLVLIAGLIFKSLRYTCYLYSDILVKAICLIILMIILQLLVWKKNAIKLNIHNVPICFSLISFTFIELVNIEVFSYLKTEIMFPYFILLAVISSFLFYLQLFDWILFYIDWPVSRFIRRNIETVGKYIKKAIESLKTKKNRKRFLNIVNTVCIILVLVGLIKIKGYLDDQKELGRSKVYRLPIKVIGMYPMPKGLYINYEVKDSVPLASGENPDEFMNVTFKQLSSNSVKFEKAYLKRPKTNNFIKVNVNSFLNELDGNTKVEFYLDAKNYFIDKEKLKKIDPKILSIQNMPSINYVMIRLYRGYHKVEKIKLGEVEI